MASAPPSSEPSRPGGSPPRRRPRKKLHTRLHRWLGMSSLAIVLVISLTGIALNHTTRLQLDQRFVSWAPLLHLYGMEPDGEPIVYRSDETLLASWDGQLLLDDLIVDFAPENDPFLGAGRAEDDLIAYVFAETIFVVEASGAIFDRLDTPSLIGSPVAKAGIVDGRLILETDSQSRFGLVDWLTASPATDLQAPVTWFTPLPPESIDAEQRERLASALRGQGLSLSRILLDLHSGRLFGTVGVILYDLAAVSLIILGITGVMLWFRRR